MTRDRVRGRGVAGAFVAVGVTLSGLGAGLSSCRDVVSGSSLDATRALCSTLQDCYGQEAYSCADLERDVSEARSGDVDPFLRGFVANRCSETCSAALGCLDNPVFCVDSEEACGRTEDCCGWSEGLRDCENDQCCANNGVRCESDEDCCELNCIGEFCGGYACVLLDKPCTYDAECCTSNCGDAGTCERAGCTLLGQPCISQDECCQFEAGENEADVPFVRCVAQEGGGSTCQIFTEEECVQQLGACALPPAPGALSCCEGLECRPSLDSQFAFCVEPGGCNPNGFDCAVDADCCEPTAVCVLGPNVSICVDDLACAKAGSDCAEDAACCSGECAAGLCQQGSGVVCENVESSCHSPLQAGPVIDTDNCAQYLPDACVTAVLEADVFCKCNSWDTTCVNRYDNCSNP